MIALSREISNVIIIEYGRDEFIRRLSDPFWFQAFSCVLGYDFHSSGTTTVTCGALKCALNHEDFGISMCGGGIIGYRRMSIILFASRIM
jgi:hypothetical protein